MMETRFIDGGEYIDRKTYIETRDENSRLRERIAELQYIVDQLYQTPCSVCGAFSWKTEALEQK